MGTLYYGDNLEILRRYLKDETVDLVYLDPPFNSAQNYNAFFHEKDGTDAASQIHAFEDTWHWDIETKKAYDAVTEQPGKVSDVMQAFYTFLGGNDMMAYLTMMSSRLVELRRVLKSTGSLYLHCDPTASHYLKLLCDAVMGKDHYLAEIIWKRSSAHNDAGQGRKQPGRIHDIILLYSKGDDWTWNWQYTPYDEEYVESFYKHVEPKTGRRYRLGDITAPGGADPVKRNPHYEFLGVTRYWRYSKERMKELYEQGRIIQTKPGAVPAYKRYLDEMSGVPLQDLWRTLRQFPRKPRNALATRRKNPWRCWSGSSKPAAIPATWCLTRFAAAARRLTPPRNSAATGSALT